MPKVKRFQNSLKSALSPHDANEHASLPTIPSQSHVIGPSISVQSPPHDASHPLLVDEVQQQQEAPT